MKLYDSMVKLSNLGGVSLPIPMTDITVPDEPALPVFHKLDRPTQQQIVDHFLEQQELAVFKAYIQTVANRSSQNKQALTELRGTLAREIRGLENMRKEFEGPADVSEEPRGGY